MHRHPIEQTLLFAPEDMLLFKGSPFAAWMERLTFENPGHGIAPDETSPLPPRAVRAVSAAASLADGLIAQGRHVAVVDTALDEPARWRATAEAMRAGRDYIVDGELQAGELAAPVHLLLRSSGRSDLGDYLYLPCEMAEQPDFDTGLRLAFLADLLQDIQGQMPPQLLAIRQGVDLVSLPAEDYIHYFRALRQRFLDFQRDFRKHRMPDPVESSHLGRWSGCAARVLRERAARREQPVEESADIPQALAPGPAPPATSSYDRDDDFNPVRSGTETAAPRAAAAAASGGRRIPYSDTLLTDRNVAIDSDYTQISRTGSPKSS